MPIRGSIANSLRTYGGGNAYIVSKLTPPTIDYIIVGGGGGGGAGGGGGGGAGGLLYGSGYPVGLGITLSLSVGGGGGSGGSGVPSSLTGPSPTLTANGGGYGAGPGGTGGTGGSGGGGGRNQSGPAPSNPTSFGAGTPGQGNRGGRGGVPPQGSAGGGGGASGSGNDGNWQPQYNRDDPENGGSGKSVSNDIWGGYSFSYLNTQGINGGTPSGSWSNYILAAGGGNGIDRGSGGEPAGKGGSAPSWTGYPQTGGDGGANGPSPLAANNACAYTGSGGGGGGSTPGNPNPAGGSGSSGSIIIRYDQFYTNVASTTGGPLFSNQNGYNVFHFLGSGSITF